MTNTQTSEERRVFWLYELTRGEGIYQGCAGPDAEWVVRQTASGIEEAGEPFCIAASAAREEQIKRLREALDQLIVYAETSDDCRYGTLSTQLVKEVATAALKETEE
jgi:hypothetical protein